MAFSDRELIARLVMCEAGGEGETGMKAVASIIMNRVNVPDGEYFRISNGGDVRNIVFQKNQFACAMEELAGEYNSQNIYNMNPTELHYSIADWAISGNRLNESGNCLWFMNPGSQSSCPDIFPNKSGEFHARINNHCFFEPTPYYSTT